MTEVQGREPSGWELLRAVQAINTRIDEISRGFVTVAVHNLLVERVRDVEADIRDEKASREKAVADLQQSAQEQRKSRAQTWTAIAVAGAGVAFGIFGAFIRQGLGLP